MVSRLRIARTEAAGPQPLAASAPDAALHRQLDALIRRHLPAATASLLARPEPTADGRFVEWWSDLSGHPAPLNQVAGAEQAAARTLLADRIRSIVDLADRLPQIDPERSGLAEPLRQAVSFPDENSVYVVSGQPVLTFWGHRSTAAAEVPPPSGAVAAPTPADAPQSSPPDEVSPARPARRLPRWLWPAAAALALLAIGLWAARDMRWPPWGPDYAALLAAAESDDRALSARLAALEAEVREKLAACVAERSLAASKEDEERLRARMAALTSQLADELALCPLKGEVRAAIDQGAELGRRSAALAAQIQRSIDECRRKEAAARKKEADAKRAEEEAKRKEEAAKKAELAQLEAQRKEQEKAKADGEAQQAAARKAARERAACVDQKGDVPKLDIYFLQDLTGSFDDDLPNMRRFMGDLVQRAARGEFGTDAHFGMGSFTDKRYPKVGGPSHYVFRNHLDLTSEASALLPTVGGMRVLMGGDTPEAQYSAILEMLGAGRSIGFRPDARKFVVVLTDAEPHVAGDWPIDDYPSSGQVANALRSTGVTPIFLVSGPSLGVYQRFVSQVGRGAALPMSADSSNAMNAMISGLRKACGE